MGTLYVVATPIGNLEDLSPRASRVLAEVNLIAAEDTRHTGRMLKRLSISTPLLSNHGFNERARVDRFLDALAGGDVALVTDSGTPAISDPGAILVQAAAAAGHRVVPIPGPSAVTAAVSASGLVEGPFVFLGFLPRGSTERAELLVRTLDFGVPLVLYESGPRMLKLAELLADMAPDRSVAVFRELTKLHEESIRSTAIDLPSRLASATMKGRICHRRGRWKRRANHRHGGRDCGSAGTGRAAVGDCARACQELGPSWLRALRAGHEIQAKSRRRLGRLERELSMMQQDALKDANSDQECPER